MQAITLPRYARMVGYTECAFFGISKPANDRFACREIWSMSQRDMLLDALIEAQGLIEDVVGYPLADTFIVNEYHVYRKPFFTYKKHVTGIGSEKITFIEGAASVSIVSDPAVVTTLLPTAPDPRDIHLYHTGTTEEILFSSSSYAGGVFTMLIPLCRLLKMSLWDNPDSGYDYADQSIYATDVDIKSITLDTTTQGSLVYFPMDTNGPYNNVNTSTRFFIRDAEIGTLEASLDVVSSFGSCGPCGPCDCRGKPDGVLVNYRAGERTIDRRVETAVVRLAHSRMPTEPCGCDVTQRMWKRDRNEPLVLDRIRLDCPFGTNDGAWNAWKVATSLAVLTMSEFVGDNESHNHNHRDRGFR